MPKRVKRTLATYDTDQREIDRIKREISDITSAARNTLPKAIEIGEWFARKRLTIADGDWEAWLSFNFADTAKSTIRYCVQLASEKQFLSAKFGLTSANVGGLNGANQGVTTEIDIKRFPTIRGALAAIAEKNGPIRIRKGAKRAPKPDDKPIDIQAEVKVSTGRDTSDVFDQDRAMRIPPPVPEIIAMQERGETFEETELPIDQIRSRLDRVSSCLNAAQGFWQDALLIAQANDIPVTTVSEELQQRCPAARLILSDAVEV